ncbi:MAG: hypothetical protein ABFQ62_04335 [Patescibacteria group bacterium]
MKKTYVAYYSFIGLITLATVLHTVFIGSLYVQHGKQIRNLTVENRNLESQKSKLQLALAKEQNINSLQEFILSEGFKNINNVEYISKSSALASR